MNLLEKFADLMGFNAHDRETLDSTLQAIQRHIRLGQYATAQEQVEKAITLAQKLRDDDAHFVIERLRVRLLVKQNHWQEAETHLQQLQHKANHANRLDQFVYVLIGQGELSQARDDWEQARLLYERAVKIAREIGAVVPEGQAQAHLADVYLNEANASFAAYLLKNALPKLNTAGQFEQQSYFMGRLGQALIQSGNVAEGQDYLGRALRLAEQTGDSDNVYRWRQALANQAMIAGHYEEARRQFMLLLANTTESGVDYLVTLCHASKTCLRLGEYDAALDYARQAVELNENDQIAQAALGIALRTAGKAAQAISHLQNAVPDYTRLPLTEADYTFVDVLRNLAAAQAVAADYATARTTYEQALTYAQQQENTHEVAGTYRDMGILYMHRGETYEAIKAWSTALELYEAEYDHARVARLYCDIANLRKQLGQIKRAMKDYEQALMLLSSIDDQETRGIVLSNAATAYVDQGDIETAESFFVESIRIALKLQDRHAEATRRGNYGWFLLSTGRPERALPALNYALRQSDNLGLNLQAAVQTDNLGLAHDEMGDYQQALSYHQQALRRLNEITPPPYWLATVQTNLAHTLIALNRLEDARPRLTEALDMGRQLDNNDVIIRALNGLAKLAIQDDDIQALGSLTAEAVQRADYMGARRLLADALILRSEYWNRVEDLTRAAQDWQQAQHLLSNLRIQFKERSPSWDLN